MPSSYAAGLATGLIVLLLLASCSTPETKTNGPTVSSEMITVSLKDLGAFRPTGTNWQIVGAVEADTSRSESMSATPGTGVLASLRGEEMGDNIFSGWEHGDLELALEFFMPKNSNSGVYLQGRYEIQLRDAWGVSDEALDFGYTGGIYQRWDPSRGEGREGFEGRAASANPSTPPGTWQTLEIVFEAPVFDDEGNKVQNARFVRVTLNGVVVQGDFELTGPTRAAAFEDEQPTGPLMLQGDHGPIAFRNIRYRLTS